MLDRIDITSAIITADALHTQHRDADYLQSRGAHYVLTVKPTSPACTANCGPLPWLQIPRRHAWNEGALIGMSARWRERAISGM
ncbi:MAG TPA: hypothetical protein VF734_15710 [Pseudonocardiaceae bacterium]